MDIKIEWFFICFLTKIRNYEELSPLPGTGGVGLVGGVKYIRYEAPIIHTLDLNKT